MYLIWKPLTSVSGSIEKDTETHHFQNVFFLADMVIDSNMAGWKEMEYVADRAVRYEENMSESQDIIRNK